jgi:hypothetical protein
MQRLNVRIVIDLAIKVGFNSWNGLLGRLKRGGALAKPIKYEGKAMLMGLGNLEVN